MPAPRIHVTLTAVFLPLTVLSLALRFFVRLKKRVRPGLDDWLATFSFFVWTINCGIVLWIVRIRAPYASDNDIPIPLVKQYLTAVYVGTINAPTLMTAAKFSILAFYYRIFNVDRKFRIQMWIVGLLCASWYLAALLPVVFQCTPAAAAYDPLIPAKRCINLSAFVVGIEVPNGILDFAVAGIAIHVLRGLQMNFWQKLGICIIFALCTLVAVIGAIRIGITYRPDHYTPDDTTTWVIVQNAFVVICCSLPTYGPLIVRWKHPFTIMRSYFTHRGSSSRFSINEPGSYPYQPPQSTESQGGGSNWKLTPLGNGNNESTITAARSSPSKQPEDMFPMGKIGVRRSIDVESQERLV